MSKLSLREQYKDLFADLSKVSIESSTISDENVYQVANPKTRVFMDVLVSDNTTPDSFIGGVENFEKLYDLVQEGKSGLILMEHYSNTDLPAFCYLLEKSGNPKLEALSKNIVAIAGMKLNQDNPVVKAFAESFTRVVIYPPRSLSKVEADGQSAEMIKAEEQKARKINMAAMRAMDECKRRGQVILVFPSGTRYRPGHPDTKRGLREIDSYLRLFDYMVLVSVNGSILEIQDEDMLNDLVSPARQAFTASPVIDCKAFRSDFMATLPPETEDPKQKVIDHVMELLEEQHETVKKEYGFNH
ncbi:MAG: 1-acyl-sn-glycerol-3-phosphate acyltransferase [Treponema sp.]|nr:1-acyl-sn-glycerol-3-phosphate acyltransferase [Treponema sp.]